MKFLIDWLDQRTGVRKFTHEALYENVPGGARWRYVWGSTLTFALFVQFVTGAFLWMAYAPSSQSAWESVYYIQHEMAGGWLLRGLHHFMAQAMTILLALHLMQVVIDGAYKAPREVNFWTGLILLKLVLALSLTGYLLPWDQKGYWATKVTTNIAGITPAFGPFVQKLLVGGPDYGHHTLTRFFALHAGVLPGMIIFLLVGHIFLFRKHGLTAKKPLRRRDAPFWPDQVLKDAVACLAVLAVVMFFVLKPRLLGETGPPGAELGAPADPSEEYSAARPEWYFLFLFQLLKQTWLVDLFGRHAEVVGAIFLPGLLVTAVAAMPILGRWRLGHGFNLGLLFIVLGGAGFLTWQAIDEDRRNPVYQAALVESRRNAERAVELAGGQGIPEAGALSLLRNDPLTQGPRLFARTCAGCHRYDGHDGLGKQPTDIYEVKSGDTQSSIAAAFRMSDQEFAALNDLQGRGVQPGDKIKVHSPPSAADLKGFASREWLAGLLDPDRIATAHYLGATKFKNGKMVRFVKRDVAKFDDAQKEQLKKVIAALSAEASLPAQREIDRREAAMIEEAWKVMANDQMRCTECHQFNKKDEDATAPDLTGYGSRDWLVSFISDPAHPRFYGASNDRMPAFGRDQTLTPREMGLVADWLRGDWFEPEKSLPVASQR